MDRNRALLVVLLTGQSLANIDTAVVNVATPSMHATLGASGAELQLIVSGYVMAYALLMITGARLGHIHGYRRVFLIGVGAFTLASLACGLALDPLTLIAARVVQGVGAALLVPQVLSSIQVYRAGDARTRALAWFVVALSASAVVGQILGGALISADLFGSGWRPVFLISVPIGGCLLLAASRVLPREVGRREVRLDVRGVVALTLALSLLVIPLVLGREAGWPVWSWVCLVLSLPVLGIFVHIERRVDRPLLNLDVLARSEVAWAVASRFAASSTYFSMLFVIALFIQQTLRRDALFSGLSLVTWVAAFGVAAPALRRAPVVLKQRAATLGALLMSGAYAMLALSAFADGFNASALAIVLGIGGFGFGVTTTALLDHLTSAVPASQAADMSGIYQAASQLAGVGGVAAFGTLYLALQPLGGVVAFSVVAAAFALVCAFAALAAHASGRPARVTVAPIMGTTRPKLALH